MITASPNTEVCCRPNRLLNHREWVFLFDKHYSSKFIQSRLRRSATSKVSGTGLPSLSENSRKNEAVLFFFNR